MGKLGHVVAFAVWRKRDAEPLREYGICTGISDKDLWHSLRGEGMLKS